MLVTYLKIFLNKKIMNFDDFEVRISEDFSSINTALHIMDMGFLLYN
jgi:hypothetical protein